MSGQNHKMNNQGKKSSGSTSVFTQPFFSYRTLEMKNTEEREIRCNPKSHEIGKVHKSMK